MWYVIHTMSGTEQKCVQQCSQYIDPADYVEMFVPQYISKKHFKQEWHDVARTLFPGYIFVDTDRIEPILEGLKKVHQYTKVLRDADAISPITEEEQKFLSDMMDDQHIVQYSEGFLIGEKVCITSGPLKHYQGCIKTVDRHRRIAKLEIPVFGGMTPVEVGFGAVHRVSQEEFHQMKQQNIKKYQTSTEPETGKIKVLEGAFAGMTGNLLATDPERDEWTIELELFGVATKVTCSREEIEVT